MRQKIKILFALLFPLALASCGGAGILHHPVPEAGVYKAVVTGYPPGIRYLGDEAPPNLGAIIERRIAQYKAANDDYFKQHGEYPPMSYLALSGGGDNGAFGAGLLHGWSQTSERPEFTIVTGVSTGALIAPFAFLGPAYDEQLKTFYTTLSSKNVFIRTASTIINGLTGGLALLDNAPLAAMIDSKITPEMFAAIGAEHRRGRRLFIATTNLETQRSMIWDIGTLANSGQPDALKLFHKILLAAVAIPGAFSPVFIDVTVDGKTYNEIHADGGVSAQVFLYPMQTTVDEKSLFAQNGIKRKLYIIRNAKIVPEYKIIHPNIMSLSERSIETLIKTQGVGDLFKLYSEALRDGLDYNLIYIPADFSVKPKEMFDPEYMSQLFALGDDMGKRGTPWMDTPPNFNMVQQEYKQEHIPAPAVPQ